MTSGKLCQIQLDDSNMSEFAPRNVLRQKQLTVQPFFDATSCQLTRCHAEVNQRARDNVCVCVFVV